MTQIQLECQGLPCPQPVLKCKSAIENDAPDELIIIVDNDAAKENVSRFLKTRGYDVQVENRGSDFAVIGKRISTDGDECEVCKVMSEAEISNVGQEKILVFIPTEVMGTGDDELGAKLMTNFLLTLKELGPDLWRIVMVNAGVKLTVPGNPCMEVLKELEENGVSILVCGTCLEFFGLSDTFQVGNMTNMLDVVTSFQLASKTIRV
ncbi:sulfurtransferase-like selenium metabolism protein YedF [Pseudodesulfovibrio cashew]|uniref:Sulfurtransferase-like selenium metabolism protein YedF n=1 Tax=Pseudodesulfovibrio cashew TaxID=2678688 RepID=A0A6I6JLX5_9BACT|nr:sulfurtransferase-like selenium metabolism protein YedF [Pseudodesulfovibrio cashew]QGY41213.1 sulfurtransferase-like selenium metabolism protein YedF [Pseudodesulfovibrio cashew]